MIFKVYPPGSHGPKMACRKARSQIGIQLGFERQFDDKNRARLDVGYQSLSFDHSDDSDFSGLVARLRYSRLLSDALSLRGEFRREPIQSSFDVSNYFLMTLGEASIQLQPVGSSLYYFAALGIQLNGYPEPTELSVNREFNPRRADSVGASVRRRDTLWSADVGLGVAFSELMSLDLTLVARQRDSNVERLSYDDLVIGLAFRYGFRPQRNYL